MTQLPAQLILLEDSDDDAEFLLRELAARNFPAEVQRARNLAQFQKALEVYEPDAILSDYNVPGCDAPVALSLARAAHPDVPFICVSGTIGEEQAVELLKSGATDYVLKDKPARLVPCLRRALDEARVRAQHRRAEEELRLSREQLQQSQRMEVVGRLAGGVAHDFNNILTTISGYSELLLQQLPKDSPHREDLQEILAAAGRATRLTRQLLAFGRRQVLEVRVLDLNEVVRGVERMLTRTIGEDVRIELSLDPALRRIRADANQLEQVLMNLAVNARDAMPKGGVFRLTTRPDGDNVELTASDTGVGMDAEVRVHLFEPFFTTKEKGKGTGLGLSTVYGIVRQSGGTISVESAPGVGATFRIRFPATDEPVDVGTPEPTPPPSVPRRDTVLIVEDEAPVRSLMKRILTEKGYEVLIASHPEEALSTVAGNVKIDIAIVDVVMPGINGPTLVERLRQQCPSLKALFVSGYVDQAALPAPQSGRSFPFLAKPFSASALVAKVRETIDAPAA
jgi:signal transduction histidine kinase